MTDIKKRFVDCFLLFFFLIVVGCSMDKDDISTGQTGINQADSIVSDSLPNTGDSVNGENLLLNSSVEEWEMLVCEYPKYWLMPSGYCDKVTRSQNTVFKGQYSVKMKALESGVTARVAQLIRVCPNSKVRICFKYYVEKWETNGARTYCYFRTGSQESTNIPIAELRSFYSTNDYYIIRGGGRGLKYLPHELGCWQAFDEIINVPPNAVFFEFGINSYYGTTLYVDDCYIVEING